MSRDEDLEWRAEERAVRGFSDLAEEGGWGFFGVVGEWEEEEEKEGEQGVEGVEDEISYKESWFVVSWGATSAEPEAANCALTAASDNDPPRPVDGDGDGNGNGNGELMTSALWAKPTRCPVSSPFPGTGPCVSTWVGTIANLRLSAAVSTLLLCLRLCTAALPNGSSFFILFSLENGDEGEGSFEESVCRVLASDAVVPWLSRWPLSW
jgi:hypothetical protein